MSESDDDHEHDCTEVGSNAQLTDPRDSPAFPHPTPSEWRRRTWFGRVKLLFWAPAAVLVYLIGAVLLAAVALAAGAVVAVVWTFVWLYGKRPDTYRGGEEGSA